MHRRGSSIVFHWSRWPRKDGRLRGETRRGEARRSEERRGEARLENGKNGEAGQLHAHAHSPSRVLGPRQLTSDGRKSFYVFIHRSFLPDIRPPPPRSSPRFHGDGIDSKIIGFLASRAGSVDQHIGADSRKSWCEFDAERNGQRRFLISLSFFSFFFFFLK